MGGFVHTAPLRTLTDASHNLLEPVKLIGRFAMTGEIIKVHPAHRLREPPVRRGPPDKTVRTLKFGTLIGVMFGGMALARGFGLGLGPGL